MLAPHRLANYLIIVENFFLFFFSPILYASKLQPPSYLYTNEKKGLVDTSMMRDQEILLFLLGLCSFLTNVPPSKFLKINQTR